VEPRVGFVVSECGWVCADDGKILFAGQWACAEPPPRLGRTILFPPETPLEKNIRSRLGGCIFARVRLIQQRMTFSDQISGSFGAMNIYRVACCLPFSHGGIHSCSRTKSTAQVPCHSHKDSPCFRSVAF
jgi:hypothetical protein